MEFRKMIFAVLIILFGCCSPSWSQETDTTIHFFEGFNAHYGFIIPHAGEIEAVSKTDPYGFDLNLNRLNTSYESWKVFNTFWISGVQAGYFNYQDPGRLGSVFVLTAYAEPVISHGRNYLFSLRGGAGFSYHTRIFDSIENPLNKFFGTRFSFPLYLSARFSYRISENIYVNLSGNYNHISNGGIKQPNFGMNFPTVSLGILYFQNSMPALNRNYTNDIVVRPGWSFLIQVHTGYKVVDRTDVFPEKGSIALGLHVRALKQLSRYYALNAGAEMILDGSIKETIRRDQSGLDYKRFALTAGQDLLFGKAIFTQYLGFYIYSPYKARNSIYQKYELSYKVHPDFAFGVYLKAHLHIAELMGLQFSYIITGRN